VAVFDEAITQVGSKEAGAAGNKRFFHGVNW
jgi:hypothetical protein